MSEKKVELAATDMAVEVSKGFGIPSAQLIKLIKHQIIAVPKGEEPATDAELALVLSVIRKSGLDPMTGQIHAWRDWQGKMAIMVGYDGWVEYANRQATYLRTTYELGPMVNSPDGKGKKCWEWIRATVHDSARGECEQVPVFLDEWYVDQRTNPAPWQKQTRHKLHVVTFRSAIREVYGMTGVVIDEDASFYKGPRQSQQTDSKVDQMAANMAEMNRVESTPEVSSFTEQDVEDARVESVTFKNGAEMELLPEEGPPLKGSKTPLLDEMAIKCSAANCTEHGMIRCQSCQQWFCIAHTSDNPDMCMVCNEGGG